MKIHKANIFVIIVGFFLLSYLLETIIKPIDIRLSSPYAFLTPFFFTTYPFTSAIIFIRAFSFFLVPLFLLSFIPRRFFVKVGMLLMIGSLSQLYSFQEIISGTTLIPLEWAISISIAGTLLILPVIVFTIKGIVVFIKNKINISSPISSDKIDTQR